MFNQILVIIRSIIFKVGESVISVAITALLCLTVPCSVLLCLKVIYGNLECFTVLLVSYMLQVRFNVTSGHMYLRMVDNAFHAIYLRMLQKARKKLFRQSINSFWH